MVDKVEVQEGLDAETLAWIEEEEKKAAETEKKIAAGEIDMSGWETDSWQAKVEQPPPKEIE